MFGQKTFTSQAFISIRNSKLLKNFEYCIIKYPDKVRYDTIVLLLIWLVLPVEKYAIFFR